MMKKHLPTIRDIAREAHLDSESVLLKLLGANYIFQSESQILKRNDIKKVRQVFGLSPILCSEDPFLIQCLAMRAKKSEEEVRDLLVSHKILPKRRLKRVPRQFRKIAEEILGLRIPNAVVIVTKQSVGVKPVHQASRQKSEWPTIGHPQNLLYLTPDDVLRVSLKILV